MKIGRWGLLALLAGSVAASLLLMLLRAERSPSSALARQDSVGDLPRFTDSTRQEQETVGSRAAIVNAVPEPALELRADVPSPGAEPAKRPERGESWREIQQMLADQDFLDACARPTETATARLKALVANAESVIDREVQEVVAARLEAGLYARIPDYVEGEPYTMPRLDDSLYRGFVSTGTGDAGWVVLERVDHPDLYALADRKKQLEAELVERAR